MDSQLISREIEDLEGELAKLRARVEQDSSSFASLEQQVAELRERLLHTRESVSEHEQRLESKQRELNEAKRLEALENYKQNLGSHNDTRLEVTRAATDLLTVLDAYDDDLLKLRKLAQEMRQTFGEEDERVGEIESLLKREPGDLRGTWESVVAAIGWRIRDAEHEGPETLDEDLHQKLAQERRRARIKEYFGKSS
jgi:predicted  nucleic acid-binding Zn-ribbon protein